MSENEVLDLSKHQTHPLSEVVANTKLLQTKALQLQEFCKHYNLAPQIGDKFHIMLEGWQYLGYLCQIRGAQNGVEPVEAVNGFKGYAELVDINGVRVAHAEAFCTRDEGKWKGRPGHALASMANTRAQSKAWRMLIGFIPLMAGFSPTPWEEMISQDYDPEQVQRDKGYHDPNRSIETANETVHGLTEYEFAQWAMEQFKETGIYDDLNNDFNGFIKKAFEKAEVVWAQATREELETAIMDAIVKFKVLKDVAPVAKEEKAEPEKKPEQHNMDMESFGTWTKGVIESHNVTFRDMSPKGISEYIKTALDAAKLDWFKDTEDDLKEAIRVYTKKVEQVLREQQGD